MRFEIRAVVVLTVLGGLAGQATSQLDAPNPLGDEGPESSLPASGTLTVFTDRNAWAAAAGGVITLVDFESLADGTLVTDQLAPLGVAMVSGTSDNEIPPGATTQFVTASSSLPFPMFLAGTLPSEPNFLSNKLASPVFASGRLTFDFVNPATAVGAFIADQSPLGEAAIEVFNGAASLGAVSVPGVALPNSFVGVVSSTPFTTATFFSTSGFDSWGLDNLEHNGSAECFLVIGDGPGISPFVGASHQFDTQVGPMIAASYPVLLTDIPEFVLPTALSPGLAAQGSQGSQAPRGTTMAHSPEWLLDGQFAVQVLMWNPGVFPGQPEQFSAGVQVQILPGGQVVWSAYGTTSGGLDIWAEVTTNAQGQRVLRFPFSIAGL